MNSGNAVPTLVGRIGSHSKAARRFFFCPLAKEKLYEQDI